jgi:hypothetical protein
MRASNDSSWHTRNMTLIDQYELHYVAYGFGTGVETLMWAKKDTSRLKTVETKSLKNNKK